MKFSPPAEIAVTGTPATGSPCACVHASVCVRTEERDKGGGGEIGRIMIWVMGRIALV